MKAVIFGANGQDGHYLSELCKTMSVEVVPIGRGQLRGDLQTPNSLKWLLLDNHPEYIFHLAATSTTKHEDAADNHAAIATGTFNLLEAVRLHAPTVRVFVAGSGYQFRNTGEPIRETDPWEPRSVYASARCYANLLCRTYRDMGLRVYFGYFFHHESPLRKARHIAQQIASAARSGIPIEIGDLNSRKEWTFAGDVVKALWHLVTQDAVTEANIGTGDGRTIGEFVEACYGAANLNWRDYVKPREGFIPDFNSMTCDPTRIFSTGWRPTVSLHDLARMMVHA